MRMSQRRVIAGTIDDLPVISFASRDELRLWLKEHHDTSEGIWIRIYRKATGRASVVFEDVLDEGLCFGWSESQRRRGDAESYLQRFTPRKKRGTTSQRNREHVRRLIKEKLMTEHGLQMLNEGER
jgi:uncharacterized protein YdeI (YjbR/CyaY-like superfamily)